MSERIAPVDPPYAPEVAAHLEAVMPSWAKLDPLRLFEQRTPLPENALHLRIQHELSLVVSVEPRPA